MPYQDRQQLIRTLETARGSRVLCYLLSDRETLPPSVPGFSTQLATEPQILFVDQLRAIGRTKQLDLFLYTRGGSTDSVWPLVRLLREYSERLAVIVPFRAHSGGTLLSLGADEVIMSNFAELSPIDPTTGNQFNPPDPSNPQRPLGISVEDVVAYFKLAEERADIKDERNKLEVLKELTAAKVHPLALGNVQRVYMQIRQLAEGLLTLHMDKERDEKRIREIITALTEKFYSHLHAISRAEAISLLGDWVRSASEQEEPLIWELFQAYADVFQLRTRFSLPEYMGDHQFRDLTAVGAFIESTELSHVYATALRISQRPNLPPNIQIQVPPGGQIPLVPWLVGRAYDFLVQSIGWRVNNDGV